ncbi:MAG: hypothetical protein KatS3mg124_0336 [Porticoccaceae bacterium]|nr:MAG: hypothetical protein KatS3mg124_0336 [Porticoccaceae bacterium]
MERRCLIIDSSRLEMLSVDGPALAIRAISRSRQLFPFRKLSALNFIGFPKVGLSALVETAEHGIPVSFFDRKGRLRGQILHPCYQPGPLRNWLEATPADRALMEAYHEWLENIERHTYARVGCVAADRKLSAQKAQIQLKTLARKRGCANLLEVAPSWLEGILTGLIQSLVAELGLPPTSHRAATLVEDLKPCGVVLGLTRLIDNALRWGIPSGREVPAYCARRLAPELEEWASRAIYTLAAQLERVAMSLETPGRRLHK